MFYSKDRPTLCFSSRIQFREIYKRYNSVINGIAILCIDTVAYGLVHLAALSIHFSNVVERSVWRICCYILVGTSGFIAVVFFLSHLEILSYHGWKQIFHPILPRQYFLALEHQRQYRWQLERRLIWRGF